MTDPVSESPISPPRTPLLLVQRSGAGRRGAILGALLAVLAIVGAVVLTDRWTTPPGGSGHASISTPLPLSPPEDLPGAPTDRDARRARAAQMLSREAALRLNAATPFVAAKGPAAPPFRFPGSGADRERAQYCLAAAALYEAGASDAVGQRAVMQVVLNRVRHPAYVPSVCGVVFQGQERTTGCQFTFTCDGSLARRFTTEHWTKALARAEAALDGAVDPTVGLATHYHTDWVHPYWSPSLDKLARVGTHLFFRWRGFWGTRTAFALRPSGSEPRIDRLAAFAPHTDPAAPPLALDLPTLSSGSDGEQTRGPARTPLDPEAFGVNRTLLGGAQILFVHPQGGAFLLAIPAPMTRKRFEQIAGALCSGDDFCRVQAWVDAEQVPRGFPVSPAARAALRFEFVRDPALNAAQSAVVDKQS